LEVETITVDELNAHINMLYVTMLGVSIDTLARKSISDSEINKVEVGLSQINPIMVSIDVIPVNNSKTIMQKVLSTIIFQGQFSKLLSRLEKSLQEQREVKRNEEKQEIQRSVLLNYLKLKRLQRSIMSKSLKKEKIWLENTISFLRFLLRRDIKLIRLRLENNPSQSA